MKIIIKWIKCLILLKGMGVLIRWWNGMEEDLEDDGSLERFG